MKVEFDYILTFDTGPQLFGDDTLNPFFTDKEQAVVYFKTLVSDESRHLLKVSMCAHTKQEPPQWFMECNGKLWSDDLGTFEHNPHWEEVG